TRRDEATRTSEVGAEHQNLRRRSIPSQDGLTAEASCLIDILPSTRWRSPWVVSHASRGTWPRLNLALLESFVLRRRLDLGDRHLLELDVVAAARRQQSQRCKDERKAP